MNKYLWLLIFVPLYAFGEKEIDCENAMTTIEINVCMGQEVDRADATLDSYLSKAKEKYALETAVIATLDKSQKAWLAYREAHCNAVYAQWSMGTIRGTMFSACMLRLTRLRTHTIWQDYLTFMDSTEPLLPEPTINGDGIVNFI